MDKYVTRMANSGMTRLIMFGKVWALTPGTWGVRVRRGRESEVYKVNDGHYLDPQYVGGRCVEVWS